MSDIIVQFKPQGDRELVKAIEALQKAKGRLKNTTDKTTNSLGLFDTTTKRNSKSMSNLGLAFSTVRSKLLLFNFAMGLGIQQIAQMAQEAAKLEAMERAFDNLSGGSGRAAVAIQKLRDATNNTVSDFDLFKQANNAMILGVTKNSDEMARMFDMAQRLGKAVGRDVASSVESLITGLGRQSVLMLDNIGIQLRANDAYHRYAQENNLVASALTDTQKRQAFFNEALRKGEEALSKTGKEVDSSQDSIDRLGASFKNLTERIGDVALAFTPLVDKTSDFLNLITGDRIKFAAKLIGNIILTFAGLKIAATGLRVVLAALSKSIAKNITFITTGAAQTKTFAQSIVNLGKKFVNFVGPVKTAALAVGTFITTVKEFVFGTDDSEESVNLFNDALMLSPQLLGELNFVMDESIPKLETKKEKFDRLTKATYSYRDALLAIEPVQKKGIDVTDQINKLKQDELKMYSAVARASAALITMGGKNALEAARIQQLAAIIDTYAAATKVVNNPFEMARVIATGLANVAIIQSSINQMQSSASSSGGDGGSKLLSFEEGGYVGGRRHSQGGTIIEAERGEFVMSRNAVESIGLETLNQMNQTGGGGSINVSVTGNVLTQDFVEGELAESIKEAIRRGSDFGIG